MVGYNRNIHLTRKIKLLDQLSVAPAAAYYEFPFLDACKSCGVSWYGTGGYQAYYWGMFQTNEVPNGFVNWRKNPAWAAFRQVNGISGQGTFKAIRN